MFLRLNILLLIFAIGNCNPVSNDNSNEEWQSYANVMKSYIKNEVNPCDNFYEYACGNYENVVSESEARKGVQHQISNRVDEKIVKLFEEEDEEIKNQEESLNDFSVIKDQVNEAKIFYESCIKAEISQLKKSEKYLNYIQNELGGWPTLESNWTSENYDWFKVNVKINRFGSGPFLSSDVLRPVTPYFYRRYFGLEKQRDFDANHEVHQYNTKMMLKILKLYDVPENEAEKIVNEIMVFGYRYNQDFKISECYFNHTNSQIIQNELSDKVDNIKQMYDMAPESLNHEFEMIWNGKKCIYNLYKFMEKADMRIVANFMAIYFLYLIHKPELTITKDIKMICAYRTRELLTPIPELMYINSKYNNSENEADLSNYLNNVRESYEDGIFDTNWANGYSRLYGIQKLFLMKLMIGRQAINVDYHFIKSKFSNKKFKISLDNYNENNINLMLFKKAEDSKSYYEHDSTFVPIDSHLVVEKNIFYIPTSILQNPIYNKNFPKAYNYGTLGGYVIGNGFGHAVQGKGQQYLDGEKSWWFMAEHPYAEKRVKDCFENQFRNYLNHFENKKLQQLYNKERYFENTIDSTGLRHGYNAYKKWLKTTKNSTSEFIPELNMTDGQLYFLSYAQMHCIKQTENDLLNLLEDLNEHRSPAEYRVLSSLSNSGNFSKEFNCPTNSKMNPENKCVMF